MIIKDQSGTKIPETSAVFHNLVARARDPLWEESWALGKSPKECTEFTAFHYYRIQYTRQARNI